MTDAADRQFPTVAYLLGGLCALLLAIQLWVIAQWSAAFDAGTTQAERVALFHDALPLGLGAMSTTGFTLFCAALGAVGVAAALVAARGIAGVGRALCLGLGALNALLVLWYLFTLL